MLIQLLPFMAARIILLRGDFPLVPLMLDIRCISFGIRLSNRFNANAGAERESLTMLSKHSLLVLIPNLGSPMTAVKRRKKVQTKC